MLLEWKTRSLQSAMLERGKRLTSANATCSYGCVKSLQILQEHEDAVSLVLSHEKFAVVLCSVKYIESNFIEVHVVKECVHVVAFQQPQVCELCR